MLNVVKFEGKTEDEALANALQELNITENEIFIKKEFIEGKLFKSSKTILSILKKKDVEIFMKDFLKKLSALMSIDVDMEILERDGIYSITLVSDNNAILIGKEGKTLNSIQTILRQTLKNASEFSIKVNLDVSNYKLKKMKNIERLVRDLAKEVKETKLSVSLEPMNSYERRLVHTIIGEYPDLETESTGEGKERHVTIKYKEN